MKAMNEAEINKQYKKMTETPVKKLIVTLAIPTIISMLVTSIYNMADSFFVGTINTSASGATGVVLSLMAILQAFGFMYGHGAGSNISRKLGAHDVASANIYASTSFYLSIATGLLVTFVGFVLMEPMLYLFGSTDTILPYAKDYARFILLAAPAMTSSCVMNNILRYEGKAFFAMVGLTSGGILNILLDALFVMQFQMGIYGAGLATCISQYVGWMILLIPFLRGKTQSQFHVKHLASSGFEIVKNIITVGSPSLARQGLNSLSTIVINTSAKPFGDAAIAAVSIVVRIVNFLFSVSLGIGQGYQPVASFNYGAKKYKRVKEGFLFSFVLGTAIMVFFGIAAFFNAERLIALFRDDPEVIAIGKVVMRIASLTIWSLPSGMYGTTLFQAVGHSKQAFLMSGLRSGIVLIPVLLILTRLFGLVGLEMSQGVSDLITAVISLPVIFKFLKSLPDEDLEVV